MSGEILSRIIYSILYALVIAGCSLIKYFASSILEKKRKKDDTIEPPYGLQPFLGVQREPSENIVTISDNGFFNGENYVADNRISG